VTQKDDAGQSITYVLGRTAAFAQGEGTDTLAPPADDSSTSSAGQGDPAAAPAPPESPAPLARVAEAVRETVDAIDAPVSFVLPEPSGVPAAGIVSSAAPPAPTVIQLASGHGTPGPAPATTSPNGNRRAVVGLLISASDTTPMFFVLALGLGAALGSALFLRRLGRKMR
jgi:hypothetical protein